MSTSYSGNKTHDDTVNALEAVRQAAVVPTASAATVRAAELVFHRGVRDSAIKHGVSPAAANEAIRENGYWS
jgi:hypothetical protein